MDNKMYELDCEAENGHFTVKSKSLDEVLDSGQQHLKRVHQQDMSREDVRKLVHEVNQPPPAM
jgi:predicted small metal-binding protein